MKTNYRRSTKAYKDLIQSQKSGEAYNTYKRSLAAIKAAKPTITLKQKTKSEHRRDESASRGYVMYQRLFQRVGLLF